MGRKNLGSKTIRLTKQQRFILKICIEQYESTIYATRVEWYDEIRKIKSKIMD